MSEPSKIYYQCHELKYDASSQTWADDGGLYTAKREDGKVVVKNSGGSIVSDDIYSTFDAGDYGYQAAVILGDNNVQYFNKGLEDYLAQLRSSGKCDTTPPPADDIPKNIKAKFDELRGIPGLDQIIAEKANRLEATVKKILAGGGKVDEKNVIAQLDGWIKQARAAAPAQPASTADVTVPPDIKAKFDELRGIPGLDQIIAEKANRLEATVKKILAGGGKVDEKNVIAQLDGWIKQARAIAPAAAPEPQPAPVAAPAAPVPNADKWAPVTGDVADSAKEAVPLPSTLPGNITVNTTGGKTHTISILAKNVIEDKCLAIVFTLNGINYGCTFEKTNERLVFDFNANEEPIRVSDQYSTGAAVYKERKTTQPLPPPVAPVELDPKIKVIEDDLAKLEKAAAGCPTYDEVEAATTYKQLTALNAKLDGPSKTVTAIQLKISKLTDEAEKQKLNDRLSTIEQKLLAPSGAVVRKIFKFDKKVAELNEQLTAILTTANEAVAKNDSPALAQAKDLSITILSDLEATLAIWHETTDVQDYAVYINAKATYSKIQALKITQPEPAAKDETAKIKDIGARLYKTREAIPKRGEIEQANYEKRKQIDETIKQLRKDYEQLKTEVGAITNAKARKEFSDSLNFIDSQLKIAELVKPAPVPTPAPTTQPAPAVEAPAAPVPKPSVTEALREAYGIPLLHEPVTIQRDGREIIGFTINVAGKSAEDVKALLGTAVEVITDSNLKATDYKVVIATNIPPGGNAGGFYSIVPSTVGSRFRTHYQYPPRATKRVELEPSDTRYNWPNAVTVILVPKGVKNLSKAATQQDIYLAVTKADGVTFTETLEAPPTDTKVLEIGEGAVSFEPAKAEPAAKQQAPAAPAASASTAGPPVPHGGYPADVTFTYKGDPVLFTTRTHEQVLDILKTTNDYVAIWSNDGNLKGQIQKLITDDFGKGTITQAQIDRFEWIGYTGSSPNTLVIITKKPGDDAFLKTMGNDFYPIFNYNKENVEGTPIADGFSLKPDFITNDPAVQPLVAEPMLKYGLETYVFSINPYDKDGNLTDVGKKALLKTKELLEAHAAADGNKVLSFNLSLMVYCSGECDLQKEMDRVQNVVAPPPKANAEGVLEMLTGSDDEIAIGLMGRTRIFPIVRDKKYDSAKDPKRVYIIITSSSKGSEPDPKKDTEEAERLVRDSHLDRYYKKSRY